MNISTKHRLGMRESKRSVIVLWLIHCRKKFVFEFTQSIIVIMLLLIFAFPLQVLRSHTSYNYTFIEVISVESFENGVAVTEADTNNLTKHNGEVKQELTKGKREIYGKTERYLKVI